MVHQFKLHSFTFHITLYDLASLGAIFVGLTLALLLGFTKSINRTANRLLAFALVTVVSGMAGQLGTNVGMIHPSSSWSWLPLQLLLATGPLIYFYVLKISRPGYKFSWRDWLHFSPVLLLQIIPLPGVAKNLGWLGTGSQASAFVSISVYLYCTHKLIPRFQQDAGRNLLDRHRHELWRLRRLLARFGVLWLLWIPYFVMSYLHRQGTPALLTYYPVYLLLAVMSIWIGTIAFSWPEVRLPTTLPPVPKPSPSTELAQKGAWLKTVMKAGRFYQDAGLSLSSLAERLDLPPHELSRIVNTALKKSFSDFINEYRVRDVAQKMLDPAYDHITLLGIAFESGFNSKTSFNRTFKQLTGKSPAEYKTDLKKERPYYNMERHALSTRVVLTHGTTPGWSPNKLNRNYMIRNYFKVAWRYMLRNKVYSTLNIAGLATGMAVALIIGLWIYGQYSYDRFLPGYDQLYQVKLNFYHSGEVQTQGGSAMPLMDELKKNYPEVKYASERGWAGQHSLVTGDKKIDPSGFAVGADFLKMFPYPLLKGNVRSVFADPNSIIITESVAKALFGDHDPMNKVIRIDNQYNVKVTGEMQDVPANSTLQFAFLLPYSFIEATNPGAKQERTNWVSYSTPEYVELQPGVNADAFQDKIKDIVFKHAQDKTTRIGVFLQPAKNWHLLTQFTDGKPVDGLISYVRMFGIIGMLVLVIACINFVNLSTARAEKRAREVGVRKSIGSLRRDLIFQFLSESLLITFIAFAVSVVMVQLVLPAFNTLTYGDIKIPYTSGTFWALMLAYMVFTGLLAGSRPAFYLSSFKPVKVLKGTIQLGKRASLPRKIMVAVQFTCSIALIISTLIIYQQLEYAKDRPKGYNVDRLVYTNDSPDLEKNYTAFKHDLLESGQVESVAKGGSGMLFFPASFGVLDFPGKKTGESMEIATTAVSPDYFKTVGMTFSEGHDFASGTVPDTLNIVINEAAAQKMRLKNPIDQIMRIEYTKNPLRIIGVVKNAIVGSPFYSATPALYVYNPGWGGAIMFRLSPNVGTQQALKKIGAIFDKYNPTFPFEYSFADQAYDSQFQLESLVGLLAAIFAGLAIFISCLGLFGLSAYVAEQRKKEIGIRKVLGASTPQVWALLSRDFLALIGISCVIASPIAFYFLYQWLQKYSYHITIGPWAFLAAALITLVITICTISYQAISSALTNPVSSLRSE